MTGRSLGASRSGFALQGVALGNLKQLRTAPHPHSWVQQTLGDGGEAKTLAARSREVLSEGLHPAFPNESAPPTHAGKRAPWGCHSKILPGFLAHTSPQGAQHR